MVESADVGWLGGRTVGLLAGGSVTLAVFVAHQRRAAAPALGLDLFRIPSFMVATGS